MQIQSKEHPLYPEYKITKCGKVFKGNREISQSLGGYKRKYKRVTIRNNKKYVHRLVLETYVELQPTGLQACHNDGNSLNNSLNNLRWDTPRNNSRDKIKHGTSGSGYKNAMSKLEKKDYVDIVKLNILIKTKYLSDYYNISSGQIRNISTGRSSYNESLKIFYDSNKHMSKLFMKGGIQ